MPPIQPKNWAEIFSQEKFYEKNIAQLRDNFKKYPFLEIYRTYGKGYPLFLYKYYREFYKRETILYESGSVYYGCLVMWSQTGGSDAIYSTSCYYDEHPEELILLANELYSYKGKSEYPEDLKNVVEYLTSEVEVPNISLPSRLTNGRDVYLCSLVLAKHVLYGKKLNCRILPIVAKQNLSTTIILPVYYWPDAMKVFFATNGRGY